VVTEEEKVKYIMLVMLLCISYSREKETDILKEQIDKLNAAIAKEEEKAHELETKARLVIQVIEARLIKPWLNLLFGKKLTYFSKAGKSKNKYSKLLICHMTGALGSIFAVRRHGRAVFANGVANVYILLSLYSRNAVLI
jgi:hypothetical protein